MTFPISIQSAISDIPQELANAIIEEYIEVQLRYARGDWAPSELNGGRFAEAILRYCEWKGSSSFTPLGISVNRSSILGRTRNNTRLPESLRFHISTCVELLLDVRNRRDVAHLGNNIDVREMDSLLVFRIASWMLAEIIRLESGFPPNQVQSIIDKLSKKHIPLVEEIGGDLIVVGTHLRAIDRALVVLYREHPEPVNFNLLLHAIQYKNSSRFLKILEGKQAEGLVYIKEEDIYLTNKGVSWVEKSIEMKIQVSM